MIADAEKSGSGTKHGCMLSLTDRFEKPKMVYGILQVNIEKVEVPCPSNPLQTH